MQARLVPCALLLSAAPLFGFQSVHVVTNGSGSALQSAIDAAASGDIVLVHGGNFGSVSVQAKSLTVIAEPAFGSHVSGLTIAALGANQVCVVSGFDVGSSPNMPAIVVSNCVGRVRLQGLRTSFAAMSSDGLQISASADVACVASTFQGGAQIPTPGPNLTPSYSPGRGVVCQRSTLALYDCTVGGGAGQADHFINSAFTGSGAGVGGFGLVTDASSFVFACRTTFTGGAGGAGRALTCAHLPCGIPPTAGADGGIGFQASLSTSATVLDCLAQGGAGGTGGSGGQCCPQTTWSNGSNGAAGLAESGLVTHLGGAGTALSAQTTVRVGMPFLVSVSGNPGDTIYLVYSAQTQFAFNGAYSGVLLPGPSVRRLLCGVVPAGGLLNVTVPVSPLPPGAQGVERYYQVLARDPSGQPRLGSPVFLTLLDPAF